MKLLGKDEYNRFEDAFIIPLAGPSSNITVEITQVMNREANRQLQPD